MRIDVTTTACRRPEILARTYASFRDNLHGIRLYDQTLHINIDPVGPSTSDAVGAVAECYFGDIEARTPPTASFPEAVIWCWLQPKTEFFLHLEDDWIMTDVFDIGKAVELLRVDPGLSCVNLRAYHFADGDSRICLSPGLHRTAHAQILARRMVPTSNPEKQLRPVTPENPVGGKQGGFRAVHIPHDPILRDIGRGWMMKSGWRKTIPVHFTTWEQAR